MNDELREALYRAFCERSTDGVAEEHVIRIAPIIDAALSAARTEAWDQGYRQGKDDAGSDLPGHDEEFTANPYRAAGTQTPAVAGGAE